MADKSKMPTPSKAPTVLWNHRLSQTNAARLSTQLETLHTEHKIVIERLRVQVEHALPCQMQSFGSSLGGTEQKLKVEIQSLKEEFTTMQHTHKQELAQILKEADDRLQTENQLLRSQIEDIQREHHEISERLKALEANIQSSQPTVETDRRKKPRTSEPAANIQPNSQLEGNPSPTPAVFDTSATVVASTPAAPVSVPKIPRFQDGRIRQGTLSLHDYAAAFAPHILEIRFSAQGTDSPSSEERNAIGQFALGINIPGERKRLAEDLENRDLAVIDREMKAVNFLCVWEDVEKVLGEWKREARGKGKGRE